MKKTLLVLVVLVCVASVFASKNSITFNFVPLTEQINTSSFESECPIHSKFGIGAELFWQRYILSGLYTEVGLEWNSYLLEGNRSPETNLAVFEGVGYKIQFSNMLSAFAHVDMIEDSAFYESKGEEGLGVKAGLGIGFDLENFTMKISCDGTVSFFSDYQAHYVDYRILPMFGCSINF